MPSIKAIKGTPDTCPGIFVSSAAVSEFPDPDRMAELSQAYQKALEDADAKQISTLVFPSLPLAKGPSFSAYSCEKTILLVVGGGAHLTQLHIDTSIFLLIHFWKALPFYRFFTQMEMPGTR